MNSPRSIPIRRGFTMLELSVVVIVLGIVVGVVLYPANATLTSMRQNAAVAEVERRITAARARAIAEGHPVGVYVCTGSVNGSFIAIASAAGITAAVDSIYPVELASLTSGAVVFSVNDVDQAANIGTYSISDRFNGVQITSVSGSSTGLIWFASDGLPEVRSMTGVRTASLTSDIDITLTGGNHIYVRAGSGLVEAP